MNAPLLASLLSRCLAIWLFWVGIGSVTQALQWSTVEQAGRASVVWMAVSTAGLLLAAVLAWFGAARVGRFLVRGLPGPDGEGAFDFDVDAAERLVFGAIGMFLVAWTAPSIVYWGIRFQLVRPDPALDVGPASVVNVATLVAEVMRLAVGLVLLLGVDGVRRMVGKLRGMTRERPA